MRLTFLGTGTSGGVPALGCDCAVCRSTDPHDKRLRTAALLETKTTRILIDSGPDIRQQLLAQPFRKIDGVLLTHIHYDHVAGIDDLRPHCVFGNIDIYADTNTVGGLKQTMPYCFTDKLYPGVPLLKLHTIVPHQHLRIGDIALTPIRVMHDQLPILGYRFGKLAYITDMKTIDASELKYLRGVETLVVNALRFEKEHHSHQLVADAIKFSHRIGARRTFLIHVTHQIGFHEVANHRLPENFQIPYDGMAIEV
ncbi:MBL fold metallo-hydrolase [Hoylesella enoeca]|uniref:MBL fold metallo-hydrolase n=1 Tax=Hoylesella enoeca TaxID=76123 RepID=UPI0028898575|nr:MBL fold metallo-hydrolase [Hoylesella enoeca]